MRLEHAFCLILVLAVLVFFSACTLQVGFESAPSPNYALTATIESIEADNARLIGLLSTIQTDATNIPSATAIVPSFLPATPTPVPAVFRNLYYSINPDGIPQQSYFPAGTERIYAFYDYSNLQDGMVVRRVWSQDGRPLFVREEVWETIRYGSDGRMEGVSIYNEEIGFPSGRYSLTLFIDGVEQGEISPIQHTFWLVEPRVESPVESPDSTQRAHIQAAGRLFLEETGGALRLLSDFQEVSHLSWFPDNLHLLVGERDRTLQSSLSDDIGIVHKLWVLETVTGERHLVGGAGENFHSPSLSPRGDYIAVLSGPTIQESCRASPSLVILTLDEEFHRQSVLQIHDFSGLAIEDPPRYGIYPRISKEIFLWTDQHTLNVELWWSCPPSDQTPSDGIYQFNLTEMTVEKN